MKERSEREREVTWLGSGGFPGKQLSSAYLEALIMKPHEKDSEASGYEVGRGDERGGWYCLGSAQ